MSNANAAKNLRPHPEERVTKSGLPDFGNQGKHFSIRLTLTPLSSPGLTRSRACPTSALLNDRNRKHPISIGDPVTADQWILDCPVKSGNDPGRANLIEKYSNKKMLQWP